MKHYRDFEVYQKAYKAALRLHKLTEKFPQSEQYGLTKQIRDSSKSVVVNFVEGFSRRLLSVAEFKRFLLISIGSCDETKVWLDFAKDLGYLVGRQYKEMIQEYEEIGKMLYGLWKRQ